MDGYLLLDSDAQREEYSRRFGFRFANLNNFLYSRYSIMSEVPYFMLNLAALCDLLHGFALGLIKSELQKIGQHTSGAVYDRIVRESQDIRVWSPDQ